MHFISHRGLDNHNYSENSLSAIQNVLNNNYIDGIEIDVRITKDKNIVLMHDPVIDFISNGSGVVKYMTLKELQKYKYGKSNEKISTLTEVLNNINTNKIILIELKELTNDFVNLVDKTIEIINNYNFNIYISSFNFKLLNYIKIRYKNIKCGLIIGYGLNIPHLKNNFDFNVVALKYYKKMNKNKSVFIFDIKNNDKILNTYDYIISDNCYKLIDCE